MKRRLLLVLLILPVIILLTFCNKTRSQQLPNLAPHLADKKVLIVYLSRTNNTKSVAESIHRYTGGDLVNIELVTPYPDDYRTIVNQVAKENEANFLPDLSTKVDDIGKYDLIFIGFPTWGMQLPPPVKSFLHKYKLDKKTIIPFNTNAGYGIGNSFQTVREMCPLSNVLEGFATQGGIERDGILFVMKGQKEIQVNQEIKKWLQKIGIIHP